ncbi:MAG: anhydro-N-acetylmuramic acid kinase [Cyclobacteriaceae bacterium]
MKKRDHIEVLGLMSGTSLDGLDMALCRFPDSMDSYELIKAETLTYTEELQNRLGRSVELTSEELFRLDADLGRWMGNAVNSFLTSDAQKPDLIASHGHTVFHQPEQGITVQIGNPAFIHAATGIRVISDFRTLDVALGGQGAPLVPIGDELLFGEYNYCLNLGGIANISFRENGIRHAFDICACNMILNRLAQREGMAYDRDGLLAAAGRLIEPLYSALQDWHYLAKDPPKSLGYEQISAELFPLLSEDHDTRDLLHTFSQHIAEEVARTCKKSGTMLISGGGAHNKFLRKLIAEKSNADIIYNDTGLVDFKEAIVFAFLGALHSRRKINVLSSVTGSVRDHIGGMATG